jgi:hypothetical protein
MIRKKYSMRADNRELFLSLYDEDDFLGIRGPCKLIEKKSLGIAITDEFTYENIENSFGKEVADEIFIQIESQIFKGML